MGFLDKAVNAASNNFTCDDKTIAKFIKEHGDMILLDDEEIHFCYEQIGRDFFVVTDRRIIYVDKQGATGQKIRYEYIGLSKICSVSIETAGFGFDDTDLNIEYVSHPIVSSRATVSNFEVNFAKSVDVKPLFNYIQNIAISNEERWNKDAD